MRTAMRIALSGTGSTGKSTLLKALQKTSFFSNYTFLPEITRSLRNRGFQINEAGTLETQIMVMNTHMENLLCNTQFVVDRCLLDGYAYTKWLHDNTGSIPDWFLEYAIRLVDTYLSNYDYIFYLPIEFEIEYDGVRSPNKNFRDQVALIMQEFICNNPYNHIYTVTGTVDERVAKILSIIC